MGKIRQEIDSMLFGGGSNKQSYDNPFDNGELWSMDNGSGEDPLESPRNQMQYYTNQLMANGLSPEAPKSLERKGNPIWNVGGKIFETLLSPLNALYSGVMHGANNYIKNEFDRPADTNPFEQPVGQELLHEGKAILSGLSGVVQGALSPLAQAGVNIADLGTFGLLNKFTGGALDRAHDSLSKHNQGLTNVLDTMEESPDETIRSFGDQMTKNEIYHLAKGDSALDKVLGNIPGYTDWRQKHVASDEAAKGAGKFGADIAGAIAFDPYNALHGLGKATEAIQKGSGGLNKFGDVVDMNKALDTVQRATGVADAKQADELLNKAIKKLGGMPNYEGITFNGKTLVSAEKLAEIGDGAGKIPAMIAAGIANPAGALWALKNPAGAKLLETKFGKGLDELFVGGKNQRLLQSIRENPDNVLNVLQMNRMKDSRFNTRIHNIADRIQKAMDMDAKLAEDAAKNGGKRADESIIDAIESPIKHNGFAEFTEKINNPEFFIQARNWNLGEIKKVKQQLAEYEKHFSKLKDQGMFDEKDVAAFRKMKFDLENRIKNIDEFSKERSMVYSEQVAKALDGISVEDRLNIPIEYIRSPQDVVNSSTEDIVKKLQEFMPDKTPEELGDIAERLRMAGDNVMKSFDDIKPGLSGYYTGTKKMSVADILDYQGDSQVNNMPRPKKVNPDDNIQTEIKEMIKTSTKSSKAPVEVSPRKRLVEIEQALEDKKQWLSVADDKISVQSEIRKLEEEQKTLTTQLKREGLERQIKELADELGVDVPQWRDNSLSARQAFLDKLNREIGGGGINVAGTVESELESGLEKTYKKLNSKDFGGGVTDEQIETILKNHKDLKLYDLDEAGIQQLKSMDELTANEYIEFQKKRMAIRDKLKNMGTYKGMSTAEYIDSLSDGKTRLHFDVSDPDADEPMRFIEKAFQERKHGITNMPVIDKVTARNLANDVIRSYGRDPRYAYLKDYGVDEMTKDIMNLSKSEIQVLQQRALPNRHILPPLEFRQQMADMGFAQGAGKANYGGELEAASDLDAKLQSRKGWNDEDFSDGKKKNKNNRMSDLMERISEGKDNLSEALSDATDEELANIIRRQEIQGNRYKEVDSSLESMTRNEMFARIRDNEIYAHGATENQVKKLADTMKKSEEWKNPFLKVMKEIYGDGSGLTKDDASSLFMLSSLKSNIEKAKLFDKDFVEKLVKEHDIFNVDKLTKERALYFTKTIKNIIEDSSIDEVIKRDGDKGLKGYLLNMANNGLKGRVKELLETGKMINTSKITSEAEFNALKDKVKSLIDNNRPLNSENPVTKIAGNNVTVGSVDWTDDSYFGNRNMHEFTTPEGKFRIEDKAKDEVAIDITKKAMDNPDLQGASTNSTTSIINKENVPVGGTQYKDNVMIAHGNAPEHEYGHIYYRNDKSQGFAVSHSLEEKIRGMFKLNPDYVPGEAGSRKYLAAPEAHELLDLLQRAGFRLNKGTLLDGFISSYAHGFSNPETRANEHFAELTRLFTHSDVSIAADAARILPDIKAQWYETVKALPKKDLGAVANIRSTLKGEYAEALKNLNEVLNGADMSKFNDYATAKETLEKFNNRFASPEELIQAYKDSGSADLSGIPEFKNVFRIEPLPDTAKIEDLNAKQREIVEALKKDFKEMGEMEGLDTDAIAEAMSGYFPHILNPNIDKELVKRTKLAKELSVNFGDPNNIYNVAREYGNEIKTFNEYMKKRYNVDNFFDTNVVRSYLARSMYHENLMYKKNTLDDFMNLFSHKMMYHGDFMNMSLDELKDMSKKLGFDMHNPDLPETMEWDKEFKQINPAEYKAVKEDIEGRAKEYQDYIDDLRSKGIVTDKDIPYSVNDLEAIHDALTGKLEYFDMRLSSARTQEEAKRFEFAIKATKERIEGVKQSIDKRDRTMYFNGYRKWITDKLGKDNVFVTLNQNFEKTPVRTISDAAMEEAQETRTAMRDNLEKMLETDRDNIISSQIESPLVTVDPKNIKMQDLYKKSNNDLYIMPKGAAEDYIKTMEKQFKKDQNGVLEAYDKFMHLFKSYAVFTGAFHVNNAVGNWFNSYLEIGSKLFDPKTQWTATKLLGKSEGKFAGYSFTDIRKMLQEYGISDGFFTSEIEGKDVGYAKDFITGKAQSMYDERSPLRRIADAVNPLNTNNAALKASRNVGEKIEAQAKIVNFITHLKSGVSPAEAAELTNKVMFDYSDLTSFEKNVMKRIVPFYTFMRKNIPLQLEKMTEKEGVYSKVFNMYKSAGNNLETDEQRKLRPDSVDQMLPIGDGKYMKIPLPVLDLMKTESPKDLLSSLTPAIKLPMELASGVNTYTGGKIDDKLKYILNNVLPVTKNAESAYKGVTGNEAEMKKTLGMLTGVKTQSPDYEKMKQQLIYEYVTQLQNQYYGAKKSGQIAPASTSPVKRLSQMSASELKKQLSKR